MKKIIFLSIFAAAVLCAPLRAQKHGHGHEHAHLRNEIGVSGGAIYSFDHEAWGSGVHLHYYRTLGDHSKWSVGVMAEQVRVHGGHFTVGAGVKYQILPRLSIGLLPGVTFLRHDEHEDHGDHAHIHTDRKTLFSAHAELVYDLFHWEKFHLGPVIDFSFSKDDSHAMAGLHFAICF